MVRWSWSLVVLAVSAGCLRPHLEASAPGAVDAGRTTGPGAPQPELLVFDPCVWDGVGDDLCFTQTGAVFDGTSCRSVCGARAEPGRPGVFASVWECEAMCPCAPEKFLTWPPGVGPFEVGGVCDELFALADAGTEPPWPVVRCEEELLLVGYGTQRCALPFSAHTLDRRSLSAACHVSVLPHVNKVVCRVWPD